MEEIEEAADEFSNIYFVATGRNLTAPIPVEDMAEHYLGYSIDLRDDGLFSDPEFLGGIDFDKNEIYVNVAIENHDGRYAFTVAHETGHHVLHKEVYLKIDGADEKQILCRDTGDKPHIEVEADRFAAALLMPSKAIQVALSDLSSKHKVMTIGQARGLASRLTKEAGFENVSNTAMINRLIDLSFISNEIGYQDGKYNRNKRRLSFAWILSKAITKFKFWA